MMRKKVLSLLLTSALTLSLFTLPVSALDEDGYPTYEEFLTHFDIDAAPCTYIEKTFQLGEWDRSGEAPDPYLYLGKTPYILTEQDGYNALQKDSTLTISNTAEEIDCNVTVTLRSYGNLVFDEPEPVESPEGSASAGVNSGSGSSTIHTDPKMRLPEGIYLNLSYYGYMVLLEDNSWGEPMQDHITTPPYVVKLQPGESFTFDFHDIYLDDRIGDIEPDTIFGVRVQVTYPELDYYRWVDYIFSLDESALGDAPSEAEDQASSPSAWAKNEIDAAISAGLVPTLTGNPGYQDAITREQFAELALCATLQMTTGETKIKLVSFSDTENPSVRKAAGLGIVTGVGNDLFSPTQATNREQIATMLYRAWGIVGTPAVSQGLDSYTDGASVSSWAADAVGAMAASGIMKGSSDTTLSPAAPCTVEQAILLVYRLYQQVR